MGVPALRDMLRAAYQPMSALRAAYRDVLRSRTVMRPSVGQRHDRDAVLPVRPAGG